MPLCANGHEVLAGSRFCGTCGSPINPGAGAPMMQPGMVTQAPNPNDFFQTIKAGLLADLQVNRDDREKTTIESALAAMVGTLVSVSLIFLGQYLIDNSDTESIAGALVWALIALCGSFFIARYFRQHLIYAATAIAVPSVIWVSMLLFESSTKKGELGAPLLVAGLALCACWVLPGLRARPTCLAASLFTTGMGLVYLVGQSNGYQECYGVTDCLSGGLDDEVNRAFEQSSVWALVIGIGLLLGAFFLDRKGWRALATPFIGVGVVFEIGGAYGVYGAGDQNAGTTLLLIGAGLLLLVVGTRSDRRGTLWLGAIATGIGLFAFVETLTESSDSPYGFVIITIAVSVGIAFAIIKGAISKVVAKVRTF